MPGIAAVIPEEEKVRARYHLGYGSYTAGQAFAFGHVASIEPHNQCDAALNNLLIHAYAKFQQLLCVLDGIECEVYGTSDLASIDSVAEVKVNRMMLKELKQRYQLAQQNLANLLGCIPNVWDQRQWMIQGSGVNVRVMS
jgi:hypothetical protein